MRIRTTSQATELRDRTHKEPPFSWMLPLWGVWFLLYFGGGIVAQSQGETGMLAATIDHVESASVRVILLAIPLQLALIAVALVTAQGVPRIARWISRASAYAATLLIAAHAAISVYVQLGGSL